MCATGCSVCGKPTRPFKSGKPRRRCDDCGRCEYSKRRYRKSVPVRYESATCRICGGTFTRKARKNSREICSRACWQGTISERACKWCGKRFASRKRECCSGSCASKVAAVAAGHKVHDWSPRDCRGCGRRFRPKPGTRRKGLYCSRSCAFQHREQWERKARLRESPVGWRGVADGYLWWAAGWRQCVICGCVCVGGLWRRCCSTECRRKEASASAKEYYRTAQWYVPKEPMPHECIICHRTFLSARPNAKACPGRCSKRLFRESKKESNRRRQARKRGQRHEHIRRLRVFERDNWICQICKRPVARGEKAPHPDSPSLDHVIPTARGGSHTYDNVQLAHFHCNSVKSDRLVTLF